MKKDIGDFCKSCFIELPDSLEHDENLLVEMIEYIKLPSKVSHNIMKTHFGGKGAVCIKKDSSKIIGQEYYFIPSAVNFSDMANILQYKYTPEIISYDFLEYSFDYHDGEWEANLFDDITAAYYVGENNIEMKNVYFGFQHHQKTSALKCMSQSIYPFSKKELESIMQWSDFQRNDGNILVGRKKNAESVYFSRVNFLGFLKFVQKFGWQEHLGTFINTNAAHLKYYLFDINIQYTYKNGAIDIGKTSIYGLL